MTSQDIEQKPYVENNPKFVERPPVADKPKLKHYQLTTRAQINGAIQDPGFRFSLPEGVLGPHRTVVASDHGANVGGQSGPMVDVPMYVELDEGIEAEREEMAARHAEELAKFDGSADRAVLLARRGEESRALGVKAAESDAAKRHEKELADLQVRQDAENKAFDERANNQPVLALAPAETDKAVLDARHKVETDALAKKQEGEQAAIDARKEVLAKTPEPKLAPSVADVNFPVQPAPGTQPVPQTV